MPQHYKNQNIQCQISLVQADVFKILVDVWQMLLTRKDVLASKIYPPYFYSTHKTTDTTSRLYLWFLCMLFLQEIQNMHDLVSFSGTIMALTHKKSYEVIMFNNYLERIPKTNNALNDIISQCILIFNWFIRKQSISYIFQGGCKF